MNEIDDEMRKHRLERENHWIKTLRTIYPYGLNEKANNHNSVCGDSSSVGKLFPSLPRYGIKLRRAKTNRNKHTTKTNSKLFFQEVDNIIQDDIKNSMYKIRILLDHIKKGMLKEIANTLLHKTSAMKINIKYSQWYSFISDIIDTKLYKPDKQAKKIKKGPNNICVVLYENKGIEDIHLSKILHENEIVNLLPDILQRKENIPVVTHKLTSTIRNKILNYKDTIDSIHIDDEVYFTLNTNNCECNKSKFCDPDHGHIITGDLRMIENNKLRKLLSNGPNYREPRTRNYKKCKEAVTTAIDRCVENLSIKYKIDKKCFMQWSDRVKNKVQSKLKELKEKIIPKKTKPVLADETAVSYLKKLQQQFVIVTIDKASNNFAFICKKYYVASLLNEVGIPNNKSPTYKKSHLSKEEIIQNNIEICEQFGLTVDNQQKTLPIMYWIPKMHKKPTGKRFIVASSKCSTKPLAKVISKIFKLIFNQINNFHDKSTFYNNYKRFWVVQNSEPVINKLNKINKKQNGKCISTYDFSTLYTKIEHKNLIDVLCTLIDFVFNGGGKKYLDFSKTNIFWSNSKKGKMHFSRNSLKFGIKYLIIECHFTIGNTIFTQCIGIPMGIDPAPFWANLYLYYFECEFITKLIKTNKNKAIKFHGTSRFIDDLCAINDGGHFGNSFLDIYPPELELKVEHQGDHATFLDLDITLKDGIFIYKLYDKRDAFPFFIVRMPTKSSNIPTSTFYGAIMSEFLRIARNTLLFCDFTTKARQLYNRMLSQGGLSIKIVAQVRKAVNRHPIAFESFNKSMEEIVTSIISET